MSDEASNLITGLESLITESIVKQFISTDNNLAIPLNPLVENNPLVKALCMSVKYSNIEKLVNLYIIFLFEKLGFYNKHLFTAFKLPLQIVFGLDIIKETIPDFTVMDICTFYRFAVIVSLEMNTEAQLIAEAIAIYQQRVKDNKKRKYNNNSNNNEEFIQPNIIIDNIVLGIIISDTIFTFYVISISESILNAMFKTLRMKTKSIIKKLENLDFQIPTERLQIIQMLDRYRFIATVFGITKSKT